MVVTEEHVVVVVGVEGVEGSAVGRDGVVSQCVPLKVGKKSTFSRNTFDRIC